MQFLESGCVEKDITWISKGNDTASHTQSIQYYLSGDYDFLHNKTNWLLIRVAALIVDKPRSAFIGQWLCILP